MTHYCPWFTTFRERGIYAVCGAVISSRQHSPEPTCPKCRRWVEADAQESAELLKKWDEEAAAKKAGAR